MPVATASKANDSRHSECPFPKRQFDDIGTLEIRSCWIDFSHLLSGVLLFRNPHSAIRIQYSPNTLVRIWIEQMNQLAGYGKRQLFAG